MVVGSFPPSALALLEVDGVELKLVGGPALASSGILKTEETVLVIVEVPGTKREKLKKPNFTSWRSLCCMRETHPGESFGLGLRKSWLPVLSSMVFREREMWKV